MWQILSLNQFCFSLSFVPGVWDNTGLSLNVAQPQWTNFFPCFLFFGHFAFSILFKKASSPQVVNISICKDAHVYTSISITIFS